jgi:hypothetical protein
MWWLCEVSVGAPLQLHGNFSSSLYNSEWRLSLDYKIQMLSSLQFERSGEVGDIVNVTKALVTKSYLSGCRRGKLCVGSEYPSVFRQINE